MKRLIAYFFTSLLISLLTAIPVLAKNKTEQVPNPGNTQFTVQYKDGLLNMHCSEVPLGKVLRKIGDNTGTKFVLTDSEIKKTPVTLSLQKVSFDNALKRILRGYSYSSSIENDVETVTVFPSRTGKKKISQPAAVPKQKIAIRPDTYIAPGTTIEVDDLGKEEPAAPKRAVETAETPAPEEEISGAGTEKDGVEAEEDIAGSETEIQQEDELLSLDDYMPVELPPIQPAAYNEASGDTGDISEQYRQRAATEQELRLKRSLEVLASSHTNLYDEALNEVVGIDSPQATEALLQAATRKNEKTDNRINIVAAEGLWHHAADLGFSDPASVAALRQMAQANDPAVRKIGLQALRDMERYRARQQ